MARAFPARRRAAAQHREALTLSPGLPQLDENVTCVGYPLGGDNISVTRGVVSRIDVSHEALLRIQIDAAINPGNSCAATAPLEAGRARARRNVCARGRAATRPGR